MSKISSKEYLVPKEILALLFGAALSVIISVLWDAPLDKPMIEVPDENVKAPWIFLGIQQLLRHFQPIWAGVFFPAVIILILILLPFAPQKHNAKARAISLSGLTIFSLLIVWGLIR